jgi:hypothetical protein
MDSQEAAMNTGLRPLPSTMPIAAAAEIMVRRGEARTVFQARARLAKQRRRDYGRTEISPAEVAEMKQVEHVPPPRAYHDDTLE